MYSLVTDVIDFVIPRLCCVCKTKLKTEEEYVCPKCILNFQLASSDRLTREFKKKFENISGIEDFLSLYTFEKDKPIQDMIHSIKYGGKFMTGYYFGRLAAMQFNSRITTWDIISVIPVPLHPVKKAGRGYNQSYYIAKGVCNITKASFTPTLLKRTRFTDSQTTMTIVERELNINGAFNCKNKIPAGNYLLVDDVITTGSTIKECARVLKEKGADKVYALSLAIAD